jgi:NAD(P)-dependent dehydrogenase (short-subunit alcohol dehydrogenase family)
MKTCAPLIRDSGGGSIVNIGSVGGLSGTFSTAYSSSKWALEGLSRSAYIYADWGIRCNVIQPGFIKTKMTASMQSNPALKAVVDQQMNDTVLLRRMGEPEEIANTALFLASDESSRSITSAGLFSGSHRTVAQRGIRRNRIRRVTSKPRGNGGSRHDPRPVERLPSTLSSS